MNKLKSIFNRLILFYWRYIVPPEEYARHLGVSIGKNCFISTREWSSEPYLISIGDNVQITRNVSFYTHGGGNAIRRQYPDYESFGKIVIGDWAYIGANSQIMPGVVVGEGAIVAAGSVVTKSVAPYTVVGGNPAKFICSIQEYIDKNLKYNLHCKDLSEEEKRRFLLSLTDDKFIKK